MNLLIDPILRTETASGPEQLTMPGLLAALGTDRIESLIGIQRHQEAPFHVFLCSLATTILARSGDTDPRQDEVFWRSGLRALAPAAGDDAWTLVVDDPARPAFMQPPLPKPDHDRLKPLGATPDSLDLLPTAKNHEVKQSRALTHSPDAWVYALISLQTMSGYFGRGNPGISRMNSGFGNRPIVEVVHSPRPGRRWVDAVARLLTHRRAVLDGPWGYETDGVALLWTEEWDGRQPGSLSGLDPNHVEIARRIRLRIDDGQWSVAAVPSSASRLDAKALGGLVGDAWLPIDLGHEGTPSHGKGEARALTVPPRGLHADLLRRLIFTDGIEPSPLQRPVPGQHHDVWLSVSVLVRGQGVTDGYHERRIPIPATHRARIFGTAPATDPLADLARNAILAAGEVQGQILRPAVFLFLQGGPEQIQFDRDAVRAWWEKSARRYTDCWTDAYFPWLWQTPEVFDIDDRLDDWRRCLRDDALAVLRHAFRSRPDRRGRRWRARVIAERRLLGAFYRRFPHLKENANAHARTAKA